MLSIDGPGAEGEADAVGEKLRDALCETLGDTRLADHARDVDNDGDKDREDDGDCACAVASRSARMMPATREEKNNAGRALRCAISLTTLCNAVLRGRGSATKTASLIKTEEEWRARRFPLTLEKGT